MFTLAFLMAVLERAAKAFASTALAYLGADRLDVLHADWSTTLGLAGGAALVSVLLNVASTGLGPAGPSLTTETTNPLSASVAGIGSVDIPAISQDTPEVTNAPPVIDTTYAGAASGVG